MKRMQIFPFHISYFFSNTAEKQMLGSHPFLSTIKKKKKNLCQHIMYKITYQQFRLATERMNEILIYSTFTQPKLFYFTR